ncbi:protein FAM107B isoform X2 [Cylas formicarius]|nr:protein FAM107B isoform X2 [Cylas formicarius]
MCVFCCCCRRRRDGVADVEDGTTAAKIKDLTNSEPLIRNSTIEELKLKLENKEILVKSRLDNSPVSQPTTPTTPKREDGDEDELIGDISTAMIPDGRTPSLLSDDGLIAPRKPVNPVRENPERQNLHKELLFNQKIGKNVLNQKTELQRALERHKNNLAKKELESHIAARTPELKKVIAERARRMENPTKEENEDDKVINKEFLQARMKLKHTNDLK